MHQLKLTHGFRDRPSVRLSHCVIVSKGLNLEIVVFTPYDSRKGNFLQGNVIFVPYYSIIT